MIFTNIQGAIYGLKHDMHTSGTFSNIFSIWKKLMKKILNLKLIIFFVMFLMCAYQYHFNYYLFFVKYNFY